MQGATFRPLIEGEIPDGGPSILVKALTYRARVIYLAYGFKEHPEHLRLARRLASSHFQKYVKSGAARIFPILYYKYMILPNRSIRISTSGEILGIFEDIPANPSVTIGGRKCNAHLVWPDT